MTETKNTMTATATDEVKDYMLDGTIPYRYAEDGMPVNYGGFFIRENVACCHGCIACMHDKGATGAHCGINGRSIFQWQPCAMSLSKAHVAERLAERREASSWVIAIDSKGRPHYTSFVDPNKVISCKDCPARRDSSMTRFDYDAGECALTGNTTHDYWKCACGFDLDEVERRLAKLAEESER